MIHLYTPSQWALFFFLYACIGWIWESTLVSIQKGRWVNRGFLYGPFLPIYGFGAVSILLFTLPFEKSTLLIFISGMASATVLEYFTGFWMERTFHVRYWDYSNYRWNLHGYICVAASICWGIFSLLLVRIVHPAISHLVMQLPPQAANLIAAALCIGILADLVASSLEATSLRRILTQLSAGRQAILQIQQSLEQQPNPSSGYPETEIPSPIPYQERFLRRLRALRKKRIHLLHQLEHRIASLSAEEQEQTGISPDIIQKELLAIQGRTDQMYLQAFRQLRRNPDAASNVHPESFRDIQWLAGNE